MYNLADLEYVTDWKQFPDFKKSEFGGDMLQIFLERLQLARQLTRVLTETREGIPFRITSGRRNEEENQQVDGEEDSLHLYGGACDIDYLTSRQAFIIMKSLILAGFTRIGFYSGEETYIHVDVADLIKEFENRKPTNVLFSW